MAICCCYEKYDGSDAGCSTQAGSTCYTIAGYTLTSSSPGPCPDSAQPLSAELEGLVAEAEKRSAASDPSKK